MPRITTTALRTEFLRAAAADELAVAAATNTRTAHGNTTISRAEQASLAADLSDAADEARARKNGTAPTISDVWNVLGERFDAAVASVNQASGSGKAFLSKAEIANLAAQDPLLGRRAQRAYDVLSGPGVSPGPRLNGADAEAQLRTHTASMYFDGLLGSEGGEPITVVRLPATPLTGPALSRALGHDPATDAGFVERFKAVDASLLDEIQQSNGDTDDAKKTVAILRGLTDLRLLIVGKDGASDPVHPTYIVGNAADGQVVGIKTGVVWT